jgi:hypothetical protein
MIDTDYKTQLLKEALAARVREVTEYEVNADNFRLAIERIGDDESLLEFKKQLEGLLQSTLFEKRKSQLMLEVLVSQVS